MPSRATCMLDIDLIARYQPPKPRPDAEWPSPVYLIAPPDKHDPNRVATAVEINKEGYWATVRQRADLYYINIGTLFAGTYRIKCPTPTHLAKLDEILTPAQLSHIPYPESITVLRQIPPFNFKEIVMRLLLFLVKGDNKFTQTSLVTGSDTPSHDLYTKTEAPVKRRLRSAFDVVGRCEIGSKVYYLAYLSVANGGSDKYEWIYELSRRPDKQRVVSLDHLLVYEYNALHEIGSEIIDPEIGLLTPTTPAWYPTSSDDYLSYNVGLLSGRDSADGHKNFDVQPRELYNAAYPQLRDLIDERKAIRAKEKEEERREEEAAARKKRAEEALREERERRRREAREKVLVKKAGSGKRKSDAGLGSGAVASPALNSASTPKKARISAVVTPSTLTSSMRKQASASQSTTPGTSGKSTLSAKSGSNSRTGANVEAELASATKGGRGRPSLLRSAQKATSTAGPSGSSKVVQSQSSALNGKLATGGKLRLNGPSERASAAKGDGKNDRDAVAVDSDDEFLESVGLRAGSGRGKGGNRVEDAEDDGGGPGEEDDYWFDDDDVLVGDDPTPKPKSGASTSRPRYTSSISNNSAEDGAITATPKAGASNAKRDATTKPTSTLAAPLSPAISIAASHATSSSASAYNPSSPSSRPDILRRSQRAAKESCERYVPQEPIFLGDLPDNVPMSPPRRYKPGVEGEVERQAGVESDTDTDDSD